MEMTETRNNIKEANTELKNAVEISGDTSSNK